MYELIFQKLILINDYLLIGFAQLSLELQIGPFWNLGFNFDVLIAVKLLLLSLIACAVFPGPFAVVVGGRTALVLRVILLMHILQLSSLHINLFLLSDNFFISPFSLGVVLIIMII